MCEEIPSLAAWRQRLDHSEPPTHSGAGACFSRRADDGSSCNVCLPANTHILFAGDSTTRYQYLQLAFALRHGVENEHDGARSINSERSWPGKKNPSTRWGVFTNGTSAILAPHELCDCYRSTTDARGFQHRYFHFRSVSLTYIELLGKRNGVRGRWWPSRSIDTCGVPHTMWGRPSAEKTWSDVDWIRGLASLVALLSPSALVINMGHHLYCPTGSSSCKYAAMANVTASPEGGVREYVSKRPMQTSEWQRLRDAVAPRGSTSARPAGSGGPRRARRRRSTSGG